MDNVEPEKTYSVMFTPPATDERGTPKGMDLVQAIADEPVQVDGYSYVSIGPATRSNLAQIPDRFKAAHLRSVGFSEKDAALIEAYASSLASGGAFDARRARADIEDRRIK